MVRGDYLGTFGVNLTLGTGKLALIAAAMLALALGGCGRKSGLDLPPQAAAQPAPGQPRTAQPQPQQPRTNPLGLFDPEREDRPALRRRGRKGVSFSITSSTDALLFRTDRTMHHFDYRDGELHAEAVNLTNLARTVGTPFYCYSTATLERHYRVFAEAFADVNAVICYAMKANSNQSVLKTFARLGAGADVVSGGELKRALAAGIPPDKILFSGVGKTASGAAHGAGSRHSVDQRRDPRASSNCCRRSPRTRDAPRAFPCASIPTSMRRRMRRFPPASPRTSSACRWSRAREVYARAAKLPNIVVTGVDMHIGSQITDLGPLGDAFKVLVDFVGVLRADGHTISHIDFGGGLGIPYHAGRRSAAGAEGLCRGGQARDEGARLTLLFEPGRMLVGNAGILVTRVLYMKPGEAKNFVVIDAAMNDLVRPTLYEAHHEILPVKQPPRRDRPPSSPTSSARSARAATTWRRTARCPSRRKAISWRS